MIKDGYTRVTDVLYPLSGLSKIDPEVVQRAADRGTLVHKICDAIINDFPYENQITDETQGYIESFLQYLPRDFIEKPDRFYCDKHMITGECDAIYKDEDGKLVLVDFKTPAAESKTWMLQASAYSYLAKLNGFDIQKIEFVRLMKNGKSPKIHVYEENFDLYLKCLEVYRYFFKDAKEPSPIEFI